MSRPDRWDTAILGFIIGFLTGLACCATPAHGATVRDTLTFTVPQWEATPNTSCGTVVGGDWRPPAKVKEVRAYYWHKNAGKWQDGPIISITPAGRLDGKRIAVTFVTSKPWMMWYVSCRDSMWNWSCPSNVVLWKAP